MSAFQSSHVPPGPADTRYPTYILARLAVAKAAADLSDSAAKLVDIGDRRSATTQECKALATQAQQLMELAAISDYEEHSRSDATGSWPARLDDQWQPAVRRWLQNIERPFERVPYAQADSPELVKVRSTLPDGLDNPRATAAVLNDWLTRRLYKKATTVISSGLRQHDIASERSSIDRHEQYLRANDVTDTEIEAHRMRIERFNKKISRTDASGFLEYKDLPENDEHHLVRRFWEQILDDVVYQHAHLREPLSSTELYRTSKHTVVIGSVVAAHANLYYTLAEAFEESICTATGIATIRVRVASVDTAKKLAKQTEGQ
ncbi:hypothetical protein [Mycobacteroides abscessus]|uniref:hypothetical protein n=1 Tax=Mycobacteroides abscessus TaxID=36809 RepID=UPI0005A55008|nr:hypothetical protein [Mycobacteroides abscessus]